jgi:predicted DCC family thiol-disulfide oxidoreductase YuxK
VTESGFHSVVLYDGVCGLCNGLNQFLLKRDRHDRFRFASLQSEFAAALLKKHDVNSIDLDTVYVVDNYGQANERLLSRSDAVLHVLRQIGGIWNLFRLGSTIPKSLRDALYNLVVQNRYRMFGKYEVCLMPEERFKHKFLDQTSPH